MSSCTLRVSAEMDEIQDVVEPRGLATAEDNPHGLFGEYARPCLGTPGCLASQTFRATKNFTCGGGDALLINDPQYIDRAEIILEKGTSRSRLFRGQMGQRFGGKLGHCPVTEDVSERLVRVPFHNSPAIDDGERVVSVLRQFRCKSHPQ